MQYKKEDFKPEDFEPSNHDYDHETETILYSDELKNGMVILSEGTHTRPDLKMFDLWTSFDFDTALTHARWCIVNKFRLDENVVTFLAIYQDGYQKLHHARPYDGWYVKRDNITARER